MQFPNSYFEDEVREGFYVPSMMKRAWAAQLEILEDIDKVCKKYNIQYFAEWGTLLGAVRHRGFIPWDDDLDIGMKRADYTKFLAVAKQELPERYCLLNYRNYYNGEILWEFLTRVVNGRNICFETDYLEKYHGFPYVTGIDIFPLDFLPPNEEEEKQQKELVDTISTVISAIDNELFDSGELEYWISQIENMCNVRLDRHGIIKQQLYALEEQVFSLYSEEEAEMITMMPMGLNGKRLRYPKSYYQKIMLLPFENTQIPVPAFYDAILRKKYGNYLEPVHKGGAHEYPFYKRQEAVLPTGFGRYVIPDATRSQAEAKNE